jgi:lysozyme
MTILGIDISKWDGNWDATKAKQAGATFAFIKASQATFTDPQFLANWQKAKDAGLLRGAYHYLDYTKPGIDQANYFADLLKNDPGELPPAIDYELRRTDNNPSAALRFLRDCLDQLIKRSELFEDATIKRPMIYTGPGFWTEYGDLTKSDYWIQFPLWNANWITSSTPIIPPPWTMWQFWQFTSKGPGEAFGSECLTMDMNRFNGTLNELMEFAGIRIPVSNLSELFDTLDEKVTNLEGVVTAINQTGDVSTSDLSGRVDKLEGQISSLDGSFTTLTTALMQRIAAAEQKITDLENTPSNPPVPTTPPSNPPVPSTPPSDPPVPTTPPSDPPVATTSPSDSPVPTTPPSDSPIPDNPPSNGITYATCITSALNVRSGPGASYPMVAGLRYGQRVKVIKRQNGWAQFENPAGWSSEAYLSFEQSNSLDPTVSPQLPTTPASYGICNTSGLNVRSGPGVTNPIAGGLTYGQRIKILSHKNGWAQIETPSGWCNESYLSFA